MITQAVILAAGLGERLKESEVPKPLAWVGGRPLLRRSLDALAASGVRDVGIVIGHRGAEIRAAFADGHPGVGLTWIENPEYRKPNGVSLRAAASFLRGRAILLMADHVFCPDVLTPLARCEAQGDDTILVVDSDIPRCFDLDDATKVRRSGELIVDIGKRIRDYDALDAGIFVVSPPLLRELAALDAPGLSDGVLGLARRGLVRAHEIAGRVWQDVDTPEARKHADWLFRTLGQELRGCPLAASDAAMCLRMPSREVASTVAQRLQARGLAVAVHGTDGGCWLRISSGGGPTDSPMLQEVAAAAVDGEPGLDPCPAASGRPGRA